MESWLRKVYFGFEKESEKLAIYWRWKSGSDSGGSGSRGSGGSGSRGSGRGRSGSGSSGSYFEVELSLFPLLNRFHNQQTQYFWFLFPYFWSG